MKTISVRLPSYNQRQRVPILEEVCPGLVLHQGVSSIGTIISNMLTITHTRSGLAIFQVYTTDRQWLIKRTRRFVRKYQDAWIKPYAQLRYNAALKHSMRRLRRKLQKEAQDD